MRPGVTFIALAANRRAGVAWAEACGVASGRLFASAAAPAAADETSTSTSASAARALPSPTRALNAAVLGAPNAGKSSLTNALVGAPVAAASPKTNTTSTPLLGAFSAGRAQVALLDLPGLVAGGAASGGHTARRVRGAWAHASAAGLALLVVDVERQARRPDPRVLALAGRVGAAAAAACPATPFPPALLILTKTDLIPGSQRAAVLAGVAGDLVAVARAAAAAARREGDGEEEKGDGEVGGGAEAAPAAPAAPTTAAAAADPWACFDGGARSLPTPLPPPGTAVPPFAGVYAVSSLKGGPGLDALRAALLRAATPGAWALPPSSDAAPTDRGWPGIAAEAVSAELFTMLRGDVPYTLGVRPVSWTALADGSVRGEVEVLVKSEAVRGIVVGTGGGRIRAVGMAARAVVKEAMAAAAAGAAAEADKARAEMEMEEEMEMERDGGGGGSAAPAPRPSRPLDPPPKDLHLIVKVRVDPKGRRGR
jgi:GTPase Era involved in 16S rRNA processing